MSFELILKGLYALLPGIITTLALLPITSDLLREKFFGPKSRRLAMAQKELSSVVKEMFFSGQHIDDSAYQKLSQSIAEKHQIAPSLLEDKDNAISSLLQMINLTEGLPKNIKKGLSDALKKEYSDFKDTTITDCEDKEYVHSYVDGFNEILINKWNEYTEDNQKYKIIGDEGSYRRATKVSSGISFFVGLLVMLVTFCVDELFWIHTVKILPDFFAFFLCVSILVSLIDSKILKDVEYFRNLVYKIIVLMVIIVIGIVLTIVL